MGDEAPYLESRDLPRPALFDLVFPSSSNELVAGGVLGMEPPIALLLLLPLQSLSDCYYFRSWIL